MAANVHACRFSVMQNGKPAHRADWYLIAWRAAAPAAANGLETVTLVQQIHVDNTP
jgi:hypothetical protein